MPDGDSRPLCATCPVWTGVCPTCGTFWWERGGKRHGLRPVAAQAPAGPTAKGYYGPPPLERLPNYVAVETRR